ncbi:hypothetical protein [Actinomadura roseirufa]|uniref:hypothetical protein n=1 Tax=Actinomadura roseirufa TaxID=2094049 RepID=UPI001041B8C7|nr:hypothetical protein [Actinomadura roseirufa]
MVTVAHEAPGQIVRDNPEVVADLLRAAFDIEVPDDAIIKNTSEDFTQIVPAAYRADSAVEFYEGSSGTTSLAVIVETQLKKDVDKVYSWPVYVAALRAKLRCPSLLVVVCPRRNVAEWARLPIDTGHPGYALAPLVLGPGTTPFITTPAQAAQHPELAVLSTIANVTEPDAEAMEITHAALATLENKEGEKADLYHDLVLASLPRAAKKILEELVKTGTADYKFKSDVFLRHRAIGEAIGEARGEARGEAKMVLKALEARGFEVSEEVRERVLGCADEEQFGVWLTRAISADSVDEIFG